MARAYRPGEPAPLGKIGYFRMTQDEHEAMKSAAKAAGVSPSAYVRQRLGFNAPETRARDQHRSPSNCACGIATAEAYRLCTERDCPFR